MQTYVCARAHTHTHTHARTHAQHNQKNATSLSVLSQSGFSMLSPVLWIYEHQSVALPSSFFSPPAFVSLSLSFRLCLTLFLPPSCHSLCSPTELFIIINLKIDSIHFLLLIVYFMCHSDFSHGSRLSHACSPSYIFL